MSRFPSGPSLIHKVERLPITDRQGWSFALLTVSIVIIMVVISLPVSDDKSLDSPLGFHDVTHHSEKGEGYHIIARWRWKFRLLI